MTAPQTLFDRKLGLVVYNQPTPAQIAQNTAPASSSDPVVGQAGEPHITATRPAGVVQPATPGGGLDLSEMRVRFTVAQSDYETPNTAMIRVYNLSDQTAKKVSGEFTRVTLQAGYQHGPYGVIFDGTIKQVMRGHETNIDSYVDIFAADGDIPYNNAVISTPLANPTPQAQVSAIATAMGLPVGYMPDLPLSATGRGKVMYGMAHLQMRRFADTHSLSWSIQNGQLTLIPLDSYIPGEAVVLNSDTGLIGFPQQTPGGILVRSLINPKIRIGTLVQIDNKAINQGPSSAAGSNLYTGGRLESLPGFLAKISADGFYKVLVHEFAGDSRGNDWYSDLVCLAIDRSAASGSQVTPYWASGPLP